MAATTEREMLAGGCFWGMQQLVRRLPGVVSTRVGYSGGDVKNVTYRNHGTHAEAIEITFDLSQTSFRDLLELTGVCGSRPRRAQCRRAHARRRPVSFDFRALREIRRDNDLY